MSKSDKRYQEAVDWLLTQMSPEASAAFWGFVEGRVTFEEFERDIR